MTGDGHARNGGGGSSSKAAASPRTSHEPVVPGRTSTDRLRDGVTILTIAMLLLYAIPSNRTIGALGGAGSVAILWGVGAGMWWCWHMLQGGRRHPHRGSSPVRVLALLLLAAVVLSYIVATSRALPPEEANPADSGMIRIVGLLGLLLVAADGPPDADRLLKLLRRLVMFGGLYAAFGLLQFAVGRPLVDLLPLPGLTSVEGYDTLESRGGFTRPLSTATHPLEYAFVLVAILPIALSLALNDRARSAVRRWVPPVLMMLAIALSSSRSAWVGLAVGIVVLLPFIRRGGRLLIAGAAAVMFAAAYLAAPRVITNLLYIFTAVGDDDSAASRTESFALAIDVFARTPVFGRGFGTFLPQYRILDNQLLLALIEIGIVGLAMLLALAVTAVIGSLIMRHRLPGELDRAIGAGLAASAAAATSLLALFDALSFPQAAGTLFLLLGLCGAYWRLGRSSPKLAIV